MKAGQRWRTRVKSIFRGHLVKDRDRVEEVASIFRIAFNGTLQRPVYKEATGEVAVGRPPGKWLFAVESGWVSLPG